MTIEIKLTEGFTIKDWDDCKRTIDNALFEAFSRNEHPDNSHGTYEYNGVKSSFGHYGPFIRDSDGTFSVSIDSYKSLDEIKE